VKSVCETRRHRRWTRRIPSRDELLKTLEERQKDLEQEIADIDDLLRRLRDAEATPAAGEPAPSI
jgi:hypothetical protein